MSAHAPEPRVLILHNRYRTHGGEERAVELQAQALQRAGVAHALLERDSAEAGPVRAGRALLRGGEREDEVARAVRELGATVVHVHNMLPLFGPRSLAAASDAGARVILHLHNFRLFCAVAVCFRDGEPCFRCRGRNTLPGLVLNCRGSLPESAAYAAALARHQPAVLDVVDRFVTPSRYTAGQLVRQGLPGDDLEVLPNYLPDDEFADRSRAAEGTYALVAGRLSEEKGVSVAVEAAALSGVPLKVAGDGPLMSQVAATAKVARAPVELLGRVGADEMRSLRRGAAMALQPSLSPDTLPYGAMEAMAAGLPVIASHTGGLPEMVGDESCVPRGDARALADAMTSLWGDAEGRAAKGEAMMKRARERFGERSYVEGLLALYRSA
jgi:glycosyltransferase involved in cell wall biosynthesis